MGLSIDPNGYGLRATDPVAGTRSTDGQSEPFIAQAGRPVAVSLSGTWAGTVKVLKSRDGGASFNPITAAGGAWAVFTGNCDEEFDEPSSDGIQYRLDIDLTSGNVNFRLGH